MAASLNNDYTKTLPTIDPGEVPYFVYTPFFALLFSPLALLPYSIAFGCWIVISISLFVVGFRLTWTAANLPTIYWRSSLIIAVSYLPFYAWCLFMGQTTAFAFFAIGLAIYLERTDRSLLSGLALSLLLYKPPLLILILPMLLITKRWKAVAGFGLGCVGLGLISLALIGPSGVPDYFAMMRSFANKKQGLAGLTNIEVDAYSFFVNLTGGQMPAATALWALLFVVVGYCLIKTWRHNPRVAWITAITWTCVLNYYVLLYDSTLIILSAVLLAAMLGRLTNALRWLLTAAFLVPWFHKPMSQAFGFQLMTIVLMSFGVYQLWYLSLRHPTQKLAPLPQTT